ncbi:hypothetical protein CSUB01_05957 [Colletotrichum sublineola]|uniref:JmjC domain-containing protein n=1 Tax=Colletotrichum sublineola TaxID=1173701 RepID=A0A066X433_COLSU|nr:hypothetical protein CSUB01_05957 [Colletotrichum sublineola]
MVSSIFDQTFRDKYGRLIQELLSECREAKHRCQSIHTRWFQSLELLERLFPDGRDIPFARIGTISDLPDSDVWYVTEEELAQALDAAVPLNRPVVIRPGRLMPTCNALGEFSETLKNHFKDGTVDVQDMSTQGKEPVRMSIDEVIEPVAEGSDLRNGRLPINLLNLKFLGQVPPGPSFLNRRRFGVIPAINSRLEAQWNGEAVAGKRSYAAMLGAREVDLFASTMFSLFAQRGSMTGMHVDNPDGTWVCNLGGLKVWIFPTNRSRVAMKMFEREGDDWVPEDINVIVLEPGDVLVMPPGQIIPHAVLTLTDSHMVGGMFLDDHHILNLVEKVLWIADNPMVTNEAIPLQLLKGWEHLRDLFMEKEPSEADRTKFDNLSRVLRDRLSCACAGPCETRCVNCKCTSSVAQDGECTVWCHSKAPAKKQKRTTGKRTRKERNK